MTPGDRLRNLRTSAGFETQKALAVRAGLSQAYIHQLEAGKRTLTDPEVAERLANALSVPITELLVMMPENAPARMVAQQTLRVLGVVSAGDGADEPFDVENSISVSALYPAGAVAYLVRGSSMIDAMIVDGDYVLVRPKPQAESGEVVVVFVPDMGTVVKIKRKKHYASANERQNRDPIPCDGCHEYGVLVGVIRKC